MQCIVAKRCKISVVRIQKQHDFANVLLYIRYVDSNDVKTKIVIRPKGNLDSLNTYHEAYK